MIVRPGHLEPFLCGCDASPDPSGAVSVDQALGYLLGLVQPIDATETVPLERAFGRVLARTLHAPLPLPRFDHALADGYAVRRDDLTGEGPWQLRLAGRLAAGDPGTGALVHGSAVRVLAGAPLPPGADAVAADADSATAGGALTLLRRPKQDEHLRRAGDDFAKGAELLAQGTRIGPRSAALLAKAGITAVPARRRLRVAFFSAGSELRPLREELAPGQVWNVNRIFLAATLSRPWIEPMDMGAMPADPATLRSALSHAAHEADLVLTTGGVDVGEGDHMPRVLAAAGGEARAMQVAMLPGDRLLAGRLWQAVCIGLPGDPVAACISWHVLGARVAEALAGMDPTGPTRFLVRAGFERDRNPAQCEFLPALLGPVDGAGMQHATPVEDATPHRLGALVQADGLLLVPAGTDRVSPGDLFEFLPFTDALA